MEGRETVSTHNLGPVGITLSIDITEDTLVLGPYVTSFQDMSYLLRHRYTYERRYQNTKYEWNTGKDRRSQLGRGRVLWVKTVTTTGKKVNIINVYQATSTNHKQQERMYDVLSKSLGLTTDQCILLGDVNVSIPGDRTNYESMTHSVTITPQQSPIERLPTSLKRLQSCTTWTRT